ncbi:MAG: hypothetical protein HY922_12975 [Elusimicrobia bacterium]|nr:hypothetical protein [Elusimicrobiota bacterium]
MDQLRRMAPDSGALTAPVISAEGPALDSVPPKAYRPPVRPLGQAQPPGVPDATVALADVRNRHWKTTDGFGAGDDRIHLSAHFDLEGNAYLSVMAASWELPYFYLFKRGMSGCWESRGARYHMRLDVSIWRARTSNIVEIYREGENHPTYAARIIDILAKAYETGREIRLGKRAYRLFYSCSVDGSKTPAEADTRRMGIALVEDVGKRGEHDFNPYIFPAADIGKAKLSRYQLANGQTVGLKLSQDGASLLIYGLSD